MRFSARVTELLVDRCKRSDAGVRQLRAILERQVLAPLAAELLAMRSAGRAAPRVAIDLSDDGALGLGWS